MKEYEIYSEGYLCTGMEGIPIKYIHVGKSEGETFEEACVNFYKDKERLYDPIKNTFWGLKLFDNKKDALGWFESSRFREGTILENVEKDSVDTER